MDPTQSHAGLPESYLTGLTRLTANLWRQTLELAVQHHPDDPGLDHCRLLIAWLSEIEMGRAITAQQALGEPEISASTPPTSGQANERDWRQCREAWELDPEVASHLGTHSAWPDEVGPNLRSALLMLLLRLPASLAAKWESRFQGFNPTWPKLEAFLGEGAESNDQFDLPTDAENWLVVLTRATRAMTRVAQMDPLLSRVEQFGIVSVRPADRPASIEQLISRWKRVAHESDALVRFRAAVQLDEALSELVPLPVPPLSSWWGRQSQQNQDALLVLAESLRCSGLEVQVRPLFGSYGSVVPFTTPNCNVHVAGGGPPGEIVRCLRVFCRIGSTNFPGRVLYRSP